MKDTENFALKLKPGKPPGAIQWQDINGRPVVKSGVGWKLLKKGDEEYVKRLEEQKKNQEDSEKNKPIAQKMLNLLDSVLGKLSNSGLAGVEGNYQTRSQFIGGADRNPTTDNSEKSEISIPEGWSIKSSNN